MMVEDTAILEKREEIKTQLAAGAYQIHLMTWVDRTGRFIQKLTRKHEPPSYWFSAIVLIMIPILIDVVLSLILGEFQTPRREVFPLEIAIAGLFLFLLLAMKIMYDLLFTTLRDHVLDCITAIQDLTDIHRYLKSLNSSKVLFFGLCVGIFMVGITTYLIAMPRINFISPGGAIITFTIETGVGMGLFHFLQTLLWEIKLGRIHFKLYGAAPSHSEIISRLSSMNRAFLYFTAILGIAVTLLFTIFRLITPFWIIFLLFLVWIPIIALFVLGQVSLSNIITNAKWQKLNQIQTKIERLEIEGNIEDKDTMDTIKRLIEYHNQILGTPNSALNIRAGLNFLNSLLLPVLAFVLANWDRVLDFF